MRERGTVCHFIISNTGRSNKPERIGGAYLFCF